MRHRGVIIGRTAVATALSTAPMMWALTHARSPAVRDWAESPIPVRRCGALHARVGGRGPEAVILLHGLVSTGAVFGAGYDRLAATRRLVVPDLLGFGRSMDAQRSSFPLEVHLDALDDLAERCGLFESTRWTIGAHSMGSTLALHWAVRHPDRIGRVVCWGAPMRSGASTDRDTPATSIPTWLLGPDTRLAERFCAISCRHRTAAGWLSAVGHPRLPVDVARAASLHTWPAYRDALRHLVIDPPWDQLIASCADAGISTQLVWGDRDHIADLSYPTRMATRSRRITVVSIPGGDHHLPLTHAEICMSQLTE